MEIDRGSRREPDNGGICRDQGRGPDACRRPPGGIRRSRGSEDQVSSHLDILTNIRRGDVDQAAILVVDQIDKAAKRVREVLRVVDRKDDSTS